jgi:hypothetical protein
MLPAPSALIRDAGHNGGNFFFAFLQPMVSQPTRNGVFDATQSPTVKVALLSGDASCTDPHLTYTMSTGPGGDASETVRVNATGGNYIVNLHTDKVAVTSGCTYRIRVVIGLIELGFADIQLFLTQGAAKNLTDNETVGLVDGKTLPIKFWIAQGVLRDVGQGTASPDHETVIVTQNLKAGVLIPAGAVSVPTTILIESVDDRPCFPGLVGQSFEGLPGATDNSCYRFRTDPPLPNGRFNTPVVVGICVDLSQVTEAQKPKIQIFQFDAADLRLPDRIKALPDAPAPFLPCDPAYPGGIGLGKPGILDFAAHLFTSLFSPKPAFARSRPVVFDLGAGGSTDGFSLFTWGLVTDMTKNAGDLQTAAVGTAVAPPPSVIFKDSTGALVDSVPVTFTAGSGSGAVTGAFTKSGRGGVSGVAQVGSWTLGSTGANALVASAPAFSGVTPTSVTFTATGQLAVGSLSFVQQPTDQIGNLRTLTVVVRALDAAGAVLPAVQITLKDGPQNASLGCGMGGAQLTAVTDAVGQATFTLIDVSAACETATLTATGTKVGFAPMSVESRPFVIADIGGTGTPTIDGQFDPSWATARCLQFVANIPGGGTTPAMLCAMNDETNVYFLVRFTRGPDPRSSVDFQFDQNHSGGINSGDDLIVFRNPEQTFEDDHWFDATVDPSCPASSICSRSDASAGGSVDGQGAFGNNGAETVYEISHPLNSGDSHDISAGRTVDFFLGVNIYPSTDLTGLARTFFPSGRLLKLLVK